ETQGKNKQSTWEGQIHTQASEPTRILGGIKVLLKGLNKHNSQGNHHLWRKHSTNS
ncbi:hypothetical protein A2U01_0083645, partial [Trifolium medium]|nr:hypothetical protein [Trifolium medium]